MRRGLAVGLALAALAWASAVGAMPTSAGMARDTYLSRPDADSTVSKTSVLAGSASDTLTSFRAVAGNPLDAGRDTLGCGTRVVFTTSAACTLQVYGNTILNNADTLNTSAYDTLPLTAATNSSFPLAFAWRVRWKATSAGVTITYWIEMHKQWFQR